MAPHHLTLQKGKYVRAFDDGTVTECGFDTHVKVGDKISFVVSKVKPQDDPNIECSFVMDIDVYHNGKHMLQLSDIASDLHLGIVVASAADEGKDPEIPSKCDKQPCVALQCQSYRHIQNHHIPIGSALLYRMVNNQWTVACVQGYFENQLELAIGKSGKGDEVIRVSPSSDSVLPLEAYQDITVIVNGEIAKKADLDKYCDDHNTYPLPSSFFPQFEGNSNANQCTSNFTPQVLELEMLQLLNGPSAPTASLPYVLLPAGMASVDLMNPCRQAINNAECQSVHFVCMSQKDGIKHSHAHFVNVPPKNASKADLQAILSANKASLYKTYQALSQSKHVYPETVDVFHVVSGDEFSVSEIPSQLLKMLDLYMSYMCIGLYIDEPAALSSTINLKTAAQKVVRHMKAAGHPSVIKKSAEIPFITTAFRELPDDPDTFYIDEANSHPYCPAHSRTSQTALKYYQSPVTDADLGAMASCVETFSASNVSQDVGKVIALLPSLLEVNIISCPLECIDGLKACKALRSLRLSMCGPLGIPEFLPDFRNTLTSFHMAGSVHSVPDFICELIHLQTLALPGAVVSSLPENIGNMTHLRNLHVIFSGTSLPGSFSSLKNLKVLHLPGPDWLIADESKISITKDKEQLLKTGGLPAVQRQLFEEIPRLGQGDHNASTGGVPPEIFSCCRLETLILSNHAFKFIPGDISKLKNLQRVSFKRCPDLETVNEAIGSVKGLQDLDLEGCRKLRTPPQEIIAQGRSALLGYIQRLSQGSVKCFQTKLMFVGLGGAGKTTLMRALMNTESNRATSVEGEAITDGIDISKWPAKFGNLNITYSVWDFAGQTVYYNTHQFFLSNRAVYLLIWNTRLGYEHSGLEFWLSSIACHCPGAPVFIVGTHADQIGLAEIPEDQLCKRFNNIAGFHRVSALDGTGIKKLRKSLLQVTSEQPYMGEQIPQAWLKFETEILSQREKSSLLAINEVEKMATHCGVYDKETIQAIRFLTSLGSLFHNEGDLLKDQVVINPQWIIDIMACLVSVHNNYVVDGRLKHSDIANIWKAYPPELHDWMLSLTEAFDLTFPLPDGGESIVPCLLPQDEPNYVLPEVDEDTRQTKMVYHFEYLPTGLFNRAQVRLYEFSDSSCLWKLGSLLKKRGQTALMKQISSSEVLIHAVGPQPENMVLLVHESFESLIADFFKGVKYEYYLPCTECIRNNEPEPSMFSSSVMRRALERKALFIQCHKDFHIQSMTIIQNNLLPQSNMDYDLQLQNTMRALDSIEETLERDVFILYCSENVPAEGDTNMIHPAQLNEDLIKHGLKSHFVKDLESCHIEDIAVELKSAKVVLLLISSEFVANPVCQRMYEFACHQLHKEIVLGMVGSGRDWQQSDLGMQLVHKLYVNLQRKNLYPDKLQELIAQIKPMISSKTKQTGSLAEPEVFISYCWTNSASAVEADQARHKPGALSAGDPRKIKSFLEERGIVTWLDIERAGRMGLYEDISDGMKQCKVVVACVSDEYVQSPNCQMEFRFAHIALRKPIVLAVVGTGFLWESTEVGMLSLGYPKVNMQLASPLVHDQLLNAVKETLQKAQPSLEPIRPITPLATTKEMEFQELFELAQRKFLRQIVSYGESREPFPRLFVADINRHQTKMQHLVIQDGQNGSANESPENLELEDIEEEKTFTLSNLTPGQFCIKMLCENEKGWHVADAGLPIDVGGAELVELWQRSSPYMARILAILKHSNTNLDILRMPEGEGLLGMLTQVLTQSVQSNVQPVYKILREYLLKKDKENRRGSLRRCHLPSGKVLWLCEEHSKLPRVTALDNKVIPNAADEVKPETVLLHKLRNLERKTAAVENVTGLESGRMILPSSSRGPSRPATARSQLPSARTRPGSGKPQADESSRPGSAKQADASVRPGSAKQANGDIPEKEMTSKRSTLKHASNSTVRVDSGTSQDRSSTRSGAGSGRYQKLLRKAAKANKKGTAAPETSLVMPADVMAHVARNGAAPSSQACCIL